MTDRLVIEITGELPDEGKYAVLAAAEAAAKSFAGSLMVDHPGIKLAVSVKAVRPGKKAVAPVTLAKAAE